MPTAEVLISSDSHARLDHGQIKAHLATKFHPAYDDAVAEFDRMMASGTGKANQAWMKKKIDEAPDAARMRNMGRPGHSDGAARLGDMDLDGVDQEVIYCEVSAFRYLYNLKEGAYEATMAFNEAMREYGSADPRRLVISYQIPLHDIDNAVTEVERVAAHGGKSLQLPVFPPESGLPDYYDDRYDKLFGLIQETGMPICCHIGLNTMLADLTQRDPTPGKSIMVPMTGLSTGEALGMWIQTGIFEKFPDLKVVFVEPGLGWIAWWLYIVDDMVTRQNYVMPFIKELPSFYFHRNVFVTYIDEPDSIQSEHVRYRLGVENIMWSSDYPHPVTSWPNSRSIVENQFKNLPPRERELIVRGNAKRVWNL